MISSCSYEDSLKSNHNQERKPCRDDQRFLRRASFTHQPLDTRRCNYRRQSFSENMQRHFPPFQRTGSVMTRQISSPNISNLPPPYFMGNKKRRKEVMEPMIDYDHSDEDVFDTKLNRRASKKNKTGKFVELGGPPHAVFVATPATAEMMRRQGSDRFMFARPLPL